MAVNDCIYNIYLIACKQTSNLIASKSVSKTEGIQWKLDGLNMRDICYFPYAGWTINNPAHIDFIREYLICAE